MTVADKVRPYAVRYGSGSMRPTILEGSLVGVSLDDRKVVDNCLFVIQIGVSGHPVIRRLRPVEGGILLTADNLAVADQLVSRNALESGEARILGRVRWIINKV